MKANDFTSAGNALQSIIDAKTQIIQDINSRGTALNQLLTAVNNLASSSSTTTVNISSTSTAISGISSN